MKAGMKASKGVDSVTTQKAFQFWVLEMVIVDFAWQQPNLRKKTAGPIWGPMLSEKNYQNRLTQLKSYGLIKGGKTIHVETIKITTSCFFFSVFGRNLQQMILFHPYSHPANGIKHHQKSRGKQSNPRKSLE